MPLYPQYSAATSGSSIKEWKDVCKKKVSKLKQVQFVVILQMIILF
jgi:protoheme ferro-lyase